MILLSRLRRAFWLGGVCLAMPAMSTPAELPALLPVQDTMAQRVIACAACHGSRGRSTNQGYFPRIAGKPVGYLYNQLINFREGRRQYPLMTYLVDHLSDDYLLDISRHFAALDLPYPPPSASPAGRDAGTTMARGQALVQRGDPGRQLPACIQCHGEKLTGVNPAIPGLLDLPRDYLNAQLGAWRTGQRHAAAPDCMATLSRRLAPEDIGAISSWLAAQPLPADTRPTAPSATPLPLPLPCGSAYELKGSR